MERRNIISFEEGREKIERLQQLSAFERYTRTCGTQILQGATLYRRSKALGNERQVVMTLKFVSQQLRRIEKEKVKIRKGLR